MTIYHLLKVNQLVKNHQIKFLGLWLLNFLNKRSLSLYFDPVLACNLRCKMCYFTDKEQLPKLKGIIPKEDLEFYAQSLFKNALKLQIGCGAEPTLYKNLTQIIQLGKQYQIPYISLTTNGNLLTKEKVKEYSEAGLDEFTISLHGVNKDSYEFFMGNGEYEVFIKNLVFISEEKKLNPKLKLRINYTFNKDNFNELVDFFDVFNEISVDVLQLRPIQKIGDTEYNDFELKSIQENYKPILAKIREKAHKKKVVLLANKELLLGNKSNSDQSYIVPYTYCYISPKYCWREGFNFREENFNQWSVRTKWKSNISKNIFKNKSAFNKDKGKLGYSVDIN